MIWLILPKHKKVQVNHFPFRIGRSITNDLQIRDETISSHHAIIVLENDKAFLIDQKSRNGLYELGNKCEKIELNKSKKIFLGKVSVYVEIEVAIDQTREISLNELHDYNIQNRWIRTLITILYQLLIVFLTVLYVHFNTPINPNNLETLISLILFVLAFQACITLIFSFLHKIQNKFYNFNTYLLYTQNFILGYVLYNLIAKYLFFYLDWFELENLLEKHLSVLLWPILFYYLISKTFQSVSKDRIRYFFVGIYLLVQVGNYFVKYYTETNYLNNFKGIIVYTNKNYSPKEYSLRKLQQEINKSEEVVIDYRKSKLKKIIQTPKE